MPITILNQNAPDSLCVAYRPIFFEIKAYITGSTTTEFIPPIVYCDVYVNDVYYKSMSKSSYVYKDNIGGYYEFDIQDSIQEIMSFNLPEMDGNLIFNFNNTIKEVYVKFRNAKFDSNGFILSEQAAPVQGTSSNSPISGAGEKSNSFFVVNSTLQHYESQSITELLDSYKTGIWDKSCLPLTKKPIKNNLCINDSSYFPFISNSEVKCLKLDYIDKSGQSNSVTKCFEDELPKNITILSVENVTDNGFNLSFTSNFNLTSLSLEITDLNDVLITNLEVLGLTSPQYIAFEITQNVKLKLVDQNGSVFTNSNVFVYNFSNQPAYSEITWSDTNTNENRVGSALGVEIYVNGISDPENDTIIAIWQTKTNNGNWIDFGAVSNITQYFQLQSLNNRFRIKLDDGSNISYSNELFYQKTEAPVQIITIVDSDDNLCNAWWDVRVGITDVNAKINITLDTSNNGTYWFTTTAYGQTILQDTLGLTKQAGDVFDLSFGIDGAKSGTLNVLTIIFVEVFDLDDNLIESREFTRQHSTQKC